jgi:predicted XRE-type DNA-binding protein
MKNKNIHEGDNWNDFKKDFCEPEEWAEIDLKVALLGEVIKARKSKNLSQRACAQITKMKQPSIARLEQGVADTQVSTLLKYLAPLGKTLAVVPLPKNI